MEALVAAAGVFAALFTWNHEQRQRVINERFNSIKARLQESENQLKSYQKSTFLSQI
jgi:division protein CdvB (Snf7/Vps24/ESCRT-III family)